MMKNILLYSIFTTVDSLYFTQVLNSEIQPFCIKSREYKIANTKILLSFYLGNICRKNKSEILKSVDVPLTILCGY